MASRPPRPVAPPMQVRELLEADYCPRLLAFSGHEFAGQLYFHPDVDDAAAAADPRVAVMPRVPSADEFVRLLNPERAPRLVGLVLNACNSEAIARRIHEQLPHLAITCWRGLALDQAAKAFSRGFYTAIARGEEGQVSVATAFDAGRALFLQSGYREGDPADYLHSPAHEHRSRRPPNWRECQGCLPPVHGEPILVSKAPWRTMGRAAGGATVSSGHGAGPAHTVLAGYRGAGDAPCCPAATVTAAAAEVTVGYRGCPGDSTATVAATMGSGAQAVRHETTAPVDSAG